MATAIRLDDDVDCLEPIEVPHVAVFPPVSGTRDAERGNPVVPKGVTIRFALNQDDLARLLHIGKTTEAVEAGLGSRFPTKAVTIECDPKPNRAFFAALSEIGDAHRRFAVEGELGQSTVLEKSDR
jgi:hypothetical protein